MTSSFRGISMLMLTALIWGTSFVTQSIGANYMEPFSFNGARFLIGAIVLLPLIGFRARKQSAHSDHKSPLLGGILCGIVLVAAAAFQQIGISGTTAGKAGFITTLYIIIVPLVGIILGRSVPWLIWICLVIATCGLYLLCINESFTLSEGDAYVLVSAFFFSLHILLIDHFSPHTDGLSLSCIQFFVCSLLSGIIAFTFESPSLSSAFEAAVPLLYLGVMSCGVAYTLQVIGQKYVNPVIASLILSLEAVFAVLAGWAILNETLSVRESMGCLLILGAIALTQLPALTKNKSS